MFPYRARLITLVRNLEGIPLRAGYGYSPEDVSTARYNTSKVLQYVSGQGTQNFRLFFEAVFNLRK